MYYHGTSTVLPIKDKILPFDQTGSIQEKGRKKNLDKVFFTKDIGSAWIYAGRSCSVFGGKPVVYIVEPVGEIQTLNETAGTTVYCADSANTIETVYSKKASNYILSICKFN